MADATPNTPTTPAPTVGRVVHYVSYGTPGGEFPSVCRAALVTEVGGWVDDITTHLEEGRRLVEQVYDPELCALVVLNPTGQFFNTCRHDETPGRPGGTWHWPERA